LLLAVKKTKKNKIFDRSPSYFTKYFYSELGRLVEDLGGGGRQSPGCVVMVVGGLWPVPLGAGPGNSKDLKEVQN